MGGTCLEPRVVQRPRTRLPSSILTDIEIYLFISNTPRATKALQREVGYRYIKQKQLILRMQIISC